MRPSESHPKNKLAFWLKEMSNQKNSLISTTEDDIPNIRIKKQIIEPFEVETVEYFDVDTWDDEDIFHDEEIKSGNS